MAKRKSKFSQENTEIRQINLNEIKQTIRGCPATNEAPAKVFTGYDHSLTEEEKRRMEEKSKQFWEKLNIEE
jgi:hypothetical protein